MPRIAARRLSGITSRSLFPRGNQWLPCRFQILADLKQKNPRMNADPEIQMVVGGGFGPPKAWPVDLQSTAFDRSATPPERQLHVERVEGIEPSQLAWKANVLPLNYTRRQFSVRFITIHLLPEKSSPEHKKSGKKRKIAR